MTTDSEPGYETPDVAIGTATIADRIAAFEMLDGMTDATQAQKSVRLSLVGFPPAEIARMLQTSIQTVHQNLYTERKKLKPAEKNKKTTAKKRAK